MRVGSSMTRQVVNSHMTSLYNEIEPYAAKWLENLIAAGHIANGKVDARSIVEIEPRDVGALTQAHFFAGIGVWSHALRNAGWPDDAEVWTGSCPCQPFSAAGKKKGFADDRHLWPTWFKLIESARPPVVLGEQVSSPDGIKWLDAVFDDLERIGYACQAIVAPACSVGAPHQRHRTYFVAIADGERLERVRVQLRERRSQSTIAEVGWSGETRGSTNGASAVALTDEPDEIDGDESQGGRLVQPAQDSIARNGLGNAEEIGRGSRRPVGAESRRERALELGRSGVPSFKLAAVGGNARLVTGEQRSGRNPGAVSGAQGEGEEQRSAARRVADFALASGATRGFWRDAEWIYCRDGKWRPVGSKIFPLAYGVTNRVGKLRASGNAIVGPQAIEFVGSVIDCLIEGSQ